ncbi:MAG: RNA methyltransferase [Bacilli bacterium]|nr:RNA methyltransferase [Bacilli bacterium]
MLIESIDNKKIKLIKKLHQKKYRDETKTFIVEGIHLVNEAYHSGNLLEVIALYNEEVDINVPTIYVTKQVMKYLSELETPYNIIGICKYNEEKEIGNKVLMLDNIQDPGNLGTIIRSSLAFDVDTIILSKTSVDLYNSKVLRGCQGMNFYINIIRDDLKDNIIKLKDKGYKIFTTDVNDGKELKNIKTSNKYVIIMGNEGNGVSKEISDLSDERIYIDMNENCESLNVAVATSIILYQLK